MIYIPPGFPVRFSPELGWRLSVFPPDSPGKRFRIFKTSIQCNISDTALAIENQLHGSTLQSGQKHEPAYTHTGVVVEKPVKVKSGNLRVVADHVQ